METRIETDGTAERTRIWFNGELQDNLSNFSLSVRSHHRVKMQHTRIIDGKEQPNSMFGADFEKFDRPPVGNVVPLGADPHETEG